MNFFENALEEMARADDKTLHEFQHTYLELLEEQRNLLIEMNRRAEFDEDIIRKYLSLVDLEEFKLRQKLPAVASDR
jgi:CPA1 family monovalent cation:H+ antiporter